jgi:hypothetical protein
MQKKVTPKSTPKISAAQQEYYDADKVYSILLVSRNPPVDLLNREAARLARCYVAWRHPHVDAYRWVAKNTAIWQNFICGIESPMEAAIDYAFGIVRESRFSRSKNKRANKAAA